MKRNLSLFDLNLLVAFDVLMTERGVTRAGQVLGVTQAAMSNTLRRLRAVFNDPLFVKVGHRMEPTACAMELAAPISRALGHVRRVLDQENFDPLVSEYVFRVAISDCVIPALFGPLFDHFTQAAPHITLDILDPGGRGQAEMLERGEVDLVISWYQWVAPGELRLQRLRPIGCVCLARSENPHVKDGLTLDSFLAARHIQYYPSGIDQTLVDEALSQMGKKRKIVGRLAYSSVIAQTLMDTDLLTVLPDMAAVYLAQRQGLGVFKLPFATAPLHIAMAWHPRTDRSLADLWLREQILSIISDPQKNVAALS